MANTRGNRYIEYYLAGKYNKLSGSIIRDGDVLDDIGTWVQIIADGVLIYQSPKMNYKTKAIAFDVSINHAKYVKIVAVSDEDTVGFHDSYMLITNAKLYN